MAFQRLFHILLGAALAATSVQASPYMEVDFFGLQARNLIKARDLSVPNPTCVDFQIGNNQNPIYVLPGTGVCVTVSGSNFVFTYPTLPAGSSYDAVHMWIGTSPPTASNPGTAPGSFPYSSPSKGCTITGGGTEATCTIPISAISVACNTKIYVVSHGSGTFPNQSGGGTSGQTGWGTSPDNNCYAGSGNCAKFWTFMTTCTCPVVTTFTPVSTTQTCTATVIQISSTVVTSTPSPVITATPCDNPSSASTVTVAGSTSVVINLPPCPAATTTTTITT